MALMNNMQYGQQVPMQTTAYNGMPTSAPYPNQPQYPLQPQQGPTGQPGVPAYGLAGANAALQMNPGGGGMAQRADYSQINANRNLAMQQGNQGIGAVQGFIQPGMQAQGQQAALSGAMGPQAQQAAYAAFQSSPGQQWLQEQAERGVTRNAAAIGGLGGGNVRQELQRQAMGLAQQDFQNNFNRLGSVADRGMQGSQLENALYQQQMQAATGAGAQGAGVQGSIIGANAGRQAASIAAQAALARDRGQYAYGAGQDIANNLNSTTSALANLANQQGAGMSDMFGNYTGNIANLLSGAGSQQATSNQALAALLANIATGSATNVSGLPSIPGVTQREGILNGLLKVASGIPSKAAGSGGGGGGG